MLKHIFICSVNTLNLPVFYNYDWQLVGLVQRLRGKTAHWKRMVICDSVLLLNLWITEDLWFLFLSTKERPKLLRNSRVIFQSRRTFPLGAFDSSLRLWIISDFCVRHLTAFFPLWWISFKCLLELCFRGKRAHWSSLSSLQDFLYKEGDFT